ncbi:toprim domain-containing protein [Endozoicomonas elysicola]|uniref:Toprim domain-containing protein n=1 Tax=Endozoicomonas elysicola TaxID=305900 RepID=A0A081KAX0_9GAMM|nr:toprim domain-containing protein [Endozoicomonas elysicola]KEI71296.1 hypothetical protein GV64_11605 [Endozoicomonas elysicola]
MSSLEALKQKVDLHELADRLGMRRASRNGQGNGMYHSPVREDKHPSLSVFSREGVQRWKDHATGEGGSCIDLLLYAGVVQSVAEASQWLRQVFSLPEAAPSMPRARQNKEEWLASRCLQQSREVEPYLINERGISESVVTYGRNSKTLGYSSYTSSKPAGDVFHGGPAVAFICRDLIRRNVTAVEYRYFDPALNGGVKNHCHGQKAAAFWCLNPGNLKAANTVVLVESPINALSVETAIEQCSSMRDWASLAVLGASNVREKEWHLLQGKKIIIAMDNDPPLDQPGKREGFSPGAEAAWQIHEQLLALNIACHLVDHRRWCDLNDVNDILREKGVETLRRSLINLEPWLIPGVSGKKDKRRPRVNLPEHDYTRYWQFRVREDFTSFQREVTSRNGETRLVNEDLCGFRIAALSSIRIQSAAATMSGSEDSQPSVVFAASVQSARHGQRLIRQVFTDDQLYNPDRWRSFGGAIYKPLQFSRMLNILERATHIGGREAVNFVGVAWRNGHLSVNEGPDSYFTEPDKQCPYHNLQFPSGAVADAAPVIQAFQATFGFNAAAQLLCWSLGTHLKAVLGFWPHMVLQADKGAGKSTLIKRLENTIGFTMFSGQSLQTEFRLVTSVSHTSQPVGWEELSARRSDVIDKAVALLQETYQYTITRRGAELTEYVLCAPVLLAGEDVPVQSLLGKVVRVELTRKGALLPDDLPRFPLRQWLQFLVRLSPERVREMYWEHLDYLKGFCSSNTGKNGVSRMVANYAAMAVCWSLLCEFSGLPGEQDVMMVDMVQSMNHHVLETSNEREPWVWILEIILGEIDAGSFPRPYKFETNGDDCLLYIRTPHIMQHLSQTSALRPKFDALPVKSDRVLKKQLIKAGVLARENDDRERRIDGKRCAHMSGLSLNRLEGYGLSPMLPDDLAHVGSGVCNEQ